MTHSKSRNRTIPQPSWSFEYIMWIFTRISGLALAALAVLGAIGAFIMEARGQVDLQALWRWMFFPNTYHISSTEIVDVEPWASAWWQAMQLLVIFFGASHAFNGLRVILEDYIGHTMLVLMLRAVIMIMWLVMLLVATFVIFQA